MYEVTRIPPESTTPPGLLVWVVSDLPHQYRSFVGREPVMPLRGYGELQHMGWDLHTAFAVDATGQAYMKGRPCSAQDLLREAETDEDRQMIADLCGVPRPMPSWAEHALAAGWTAPDGWKP